MKKVLSSAYSISSSAVESDQTMTRQKCAKRISDVENGVLQAGVIFV